MVTPNPDSTSAEADERYDREREFHDQRFTEDDRSANRFYPLMKAADAYFSERLDDLPADASFLEYGCGADAYTSIHLAERGRHAVGVDLSEVAIAKAEEKVRALGLADLIDLRVMNAEALDLADDSFDAVCGVGVIHHLKLERAFAEVSRVLKPGGRALFLEPMGHNPIINLYRRRTPEQRTPDEHPLLSSDLELARQYFDGVESTHFALAPLVAIPFAQSRLARRVLPPLEAADRALFKNFPASRRFGWLVVIELIRPRRSPERAAA